MVQMGFARSWADLLINCVTSVFYSAMLNGEVGLTFKPQRGLRQENPSSPYLFLFCGEGLLTLMRLANQEAVVRGAEIC